MNIEKEIWDENDYEQMRWHDIQIYAVAFDNEGFKLSFDIDYIVEWIYPKDNEITYKFIVSPSTLVFRNVWNLDIDITGFAMEIQDIERTNPKEPKNIRHIIDNIEYDWEITTNCGKISFTSVGFKLFMRKPPVLIETTKIGLIERGGICFNEI